ncbi:MAG TPA: cytochrome c3 family protein, partial [Kofleriaceae bacterium]|nr:cytochrome c3 family protein [Kofleriaceae bacterium]
MRITRIIPVVVIVVALGVAGGSPPANDEWSPVVYPYQHLPLIFSHAKHQARGIACAACHAAATTSRSAVDNLLPTERECRACHPIDRREPERGVAGAPPARCAACHPGYAADKPIERVRVETAPLKFDHAAHVKTPCAGCHGDLSKVDLATRRHLPTMQSCLTCHTDGNDARRCTTCHLAQLGGLVETELPHGSLVPKHSGMGDAHGPGFTKDHRQEAMQRDATCGACHDRSECITCHQGVAKPAEFHPGNYVVTHVVEARRGTPDCSACHRAQSFCVACHERS